MLNFLQKPMKGILDPAPCISEKTYDIAEFRRVDLPHAS